MIIFRAWEPIPSASKSKWAEVKSSRGGRRQKAGDPINYRQAVEFKERFKFPATVSISFRGTGQASAKYGDTETNPNVSFTDNKIILM